MSENISENVFRLHIIANSDSLHDQELKIKVRDNVLKHSELLYRECASVDDAIQVSKDSISTFNRIAQETLEYYGCKDKVKTYVTKEYFDTRYYDDFTLPAGVYNSLKIEIGKAEGHNWWCVMFPSVCLSGCTDDLSETLTDEEIDMLKSDKYVVRFKAVEIYEKIKSSI